jgi:phosphoesterase RecJ-like protein
MTLSQEELKKFDFQKGDTEGFVNYALTIEGIKLAIIMIEDKSEQYVKLSLRSSGSFSVNEMAKKHFHGGGHINAAGGKYNGSIGETVQKLTSLLPQYQQALHTS